MMGKFGKRSVAGFEIVLMIFSFFAISYGLRPSSDIFVEVGRDGGAENSHGFLGSVIVAILNTIGKPMVPVVSAFDINHNDIDDKEECKGMTGSECYNYLTTNHVVSGEVWTSYPISSRAKGLGCCFIAKDGGICGTSSPGNCFDDSPFAEGALCSDTEFCQKGCCYDELSGVYDSNVLRAICPPSASWTDKSCGSLPGANRGCCVLGSESKFSTYQQCVVGSRDFGNGVDWRGDVGEGKCFLLANAHKNGACILGDRKCKFVSDVECFNMKGSFFNNTLCTSSSLDTICKKTRSTGCVDGRDGVYFIDSCGNPANIYDADRVSDDSYWDMVVNVSDACGYAAKDGNANNAKCGNCDLSLGGVCASASEDDFSVDEGDYYCRDSSCKFKKYDGSVVSYKNGESWCSYDGVIGNGSDIPGSRHWKYSCNRGVVETEACGDARKEICVQSDTNGVTNANCIINNWVSCFNINKAMSSGVNETGVAECIGANSSKCGDKDIYPEDADKMSCLERVKVDCNANNVLSIIKACKEAVGCRVESVHIGNYFKFDVCLPEYPAGFDFNDAAPQKSARLSCGMASMKCRVVQRKKMWGGCEYVANEDCLDAEFAIKMNDFCRRIGDCGGSVGINGEWSANYIVKKDGKLKRSLFLSKSSREKLMGLSSPDGNYARAGNYVKILKSSGIWGGVSNPDYEKYKGKDILERASGLGGVGLFVSFLGTGKFMFMGFETGFFGGSNAAIAGFGGAITGAAMGAAVGVRYANHLKLSPGGSILMALGGAMIGAAIGYYLVMGGAIGWGIIIAGLILMALSTIFGSGDCDDIDIDFECLPWQPVSGGELCGECNGDPLRPCSKYRCESLGARCRFINTGTDDELCVDSDPHDSTPPVVGRNVDVGSEGVVYVDNDKGFSVEKEGGGCLGANERVLIAVSTSEPSECRFDVEAREKFGDFSNTFDSGGSYVWNHSVSYVLPDISGGESKGIKYSEKWRLFIRCRDRSGLESLKAYGVDMCVDEGDDVMPPKIIEVYPGDGTLVGSDDEVKAGGVITSEFADCRWDSEDVDYADMKNEFVSVDSFGSPSSTLGYRSVVNFPVDGEVNSYYVRCMDQPWLGDDFANRNANVESVVLHLGRVRSHISIDKLWPNADFEIGTSVADVPLKIASSGGGNDHFCSWSFSGFDSMNRLIEGGGKRTHEILLSQAPGLKKIYVRCWDETGDSAENVTEFLISRDSSPPSVARVWQNGGYINLFLDEEGVCKYSMDGCRFAWDEGVSIGRGYSFRFGVSAGKRYYVRCEDVFKNSPQGCSVEVVAT